MALLPASLPASIKKDICPNRALINTFIQTQAHHLLSLHSNALGEVQGVGVVERHHKIQIEFMMNWNTVHKWGHALVCLGSCW